MELTKIMTIILKGNMEGAEIGTWTRSVNYRKDAFTSRVWRAWKRYTTFLTLQMENDSLVEWNQLAQARQCYLCSNSYCTQTNCKSLSLNGKKPSCIEST